MVERIVLKNIFDLHVHLREGPMLQKVFPFTETFFSVAVVIPNLTDPIKTARDFKKYQKEIFSYKHRDFEPIMGIMLTPNTTPEIVEEAYRAGAKFLKNIPVGVSTNGCGVALNNLSNVYPALKKAAELKMPLLIHSEVSVHIRDYNDWIERVNRSIPYLENLVKDSPELKIVIEHANTLKLIEFIQRANDNVKGTLSCHHQILTWKDVVDEQGNVVNPLNFCLPLAGKETDRLAVMEAAILDHENFGFGSDSAPHLIMNKRGATPAAGIFSIPVAIQLLAEIFEEKGYLAELQPFLSPKWAPKFYGFKPTKKEITLVKKGWRIPFEYENVPIFKGGEKINWSIK